MDVMIEYWGDLAVSLLNTEGQDATDLNEQSSDHASSRISDAALPVPQPNESTRVDVTEERASTIKRAMSTAGEANSNTKRNKSSQGEYIERGLVAVGDGLRAIDERKPPSAICISSDKSDEILNAIREETNSIQALLLYLKGKDN
ncbi:hypothetical protein JG688_00013566 [Phytophthora aleatoria]|uniref:Uncharacterized protein n=1 Tax=Phytophthora aleatoria TaxID=2496075 RepID=A0A8J5I9F5_9STRA|nr:hypothetical protein JG688_00013566 [Phytophthora aleatoria]